VTVTQLHGVEVILDKHLPLTKREVRPDGTEVVIPVLCWHIDGKIYINPERYEELKAAMDQVAWLDKAVELEKDGFPTIGRSRKP
jgi:hypothetical protein